MGETNVARGCLSDEHFCEHVLGECPSGAECTCEICKTDNCNV